MSKRSILVLLVWVSIVLCGCATLMGPVPLDRQNRGVEIIYDTPLYGYAPLVYLSNDKCRHGHEALWWLQLKAQSYGADAVIGTKLWKDPWTGRYWVSGLAVKWVKEGGQGSD